MSRTILPALALFASGISIQAATLTVTTVADAGAGSLRQAILDANADAVADVISFNIAPGGLQTIAPTNALPDITEPMTLDATTQPGFAGVPIIELNGADAGASGLRILASGCTVRGLVINRVPGNGIDLIGGGGHVISGNYIGTDAGGTIARANNGRGINIEGSSNNRIGGTTTADRNVISGNFTAGVEISRNFFAGGPVPTGNVILGNYIGADTTGMTNVFNGGNGINLLGASNTVVGGTAPGAGNLILGIFQGILLQSSFDPTAGNRIEGNQILRNFIGLSFAALAQNNAVGGTNPGAGNIIAFQSGRGMAISGFGSTNNTIRGNSIFSNGLQGGELGLDLGFDGVTLNDPGDVDTGDNWRQNFPVLTTATNSATNVVIHGTLNSLPNRTYHLDFFSSLARHPTGYGEGQKYLGSTIVMTDGGGNVSFTANLTATLLGRNITATATDESGNTSEFSLAIAAASTAPGQTFTVINTNNNGAGSLRDAMERANTAVTVGDVIAFNITGSGPFTIFPSPPLPEIADLLTIDGTTQPGFAGTPIIELSGASAGGGAGADGLRITAGNCVVRGLVINRFGSDGVELIGAGNSRIENCYLGLNTAGTGALGNSSRGIFINNSANNVIGGAGFGNVISANNTHGIEMTGTNATNNAVLGNVIGLGVNAADLGNAQQGILVSASGSFIGGAAPGARNVIAGNNGSGISFLNAGASNNAAQGNLIGFTITPTGVVTRANSQDGILLNNAPRNRIGGTTPGAGNYIAGNFSHGIEAIGVGTVENRIEGNLIGLDVNLDARGNAGFGATFNTASRNTAGGTTPGAGNTIAFNGLDGVFVSSGNQNRILNNSIFLNGGLGIDLGVNGVTANDAGDADSGANNLQNFPLITAATNTEGFVVIVGLLNSQASSNYTVQVFFNDACDPTGNGEGQSFLGAINVTADGSGNAAFSLTIPTATPGRFVTANATDAAGNTSEFGPCATAVNLLAPAIFVVNNTNDSGSGSLRQALLDSNSRVTAGDRIEFNIPGTGPHNIGLLTPLPPITDTVIIDGWTQPGSSPNTLGYGSLSNNAAPQICINGTGAGPLADGLRLSADNNIVQGLIIIGFNGDAIEITGGSNVVQGNFLGAVPAGSTMPAGNTGNGIHINNASFNLIGGTNPAALNRIGNNFGDGVFIAGGSNNTVRGSSITSNSGLGIDLGLNGVTANDAGDPDVGANFLQNYPVLSNAVLSGSTMFVDGALNSRPNSSYVIEFFVNAACDSSLNGEGQHLLALATVPTDVSGNATFSFSLPAAPNGAAITATATDTNGNVSEFSRCVTVRLPPNEAPVLAAIPNLTVDEQTSLNYTNAASDPDLPPQTLTFSLLVGAATGLSIDSQTGVMTWIPTEAQGPGTFPVTVRVTDNGSPPRSDEQSFTILVREVNRRPTTVPIADQTVIAGTALILPIAAGDPDIPANPLGFTLLPGAPAGDTVHPTFGVFSWTPTLADAGTTNLITVVVTDNGTPALTVSNTFRVAVLSATALRLNATLTMNGLPRIELRGIPDEGYLLEASSDLITWFPMALLNASTPAGLAVFLEEESTRWPHRFYRAKEAPGTPVDLNLPPPTPWPPLVFPVATGPQEVPSDDGIGDGARIVHGMFLHNGEKLLERVDLAIPGRGQVHFELRRTYRSRFDYHGPLGHGWTHACNEALQILPSGNVVRLNASGHLDEWTRQTDGSYVAPRGHFGLLKRQPDGTFVHRSPGGFKRYFRGDGRLFAHQDRAGNQMFFLYDSQGNLGRVIDVFGRQIQFTFAPDAGGVDRLTRVADYMGREVVYSYDANGDLATVRSPVVTGTSTGNNFPAGRTERYTYSSGHGSAVLNHNLLTVTAPEEVAGGGPPMLVCRYGENPADPLTFDRIISQTIGGTNATGVEAGGTMTVQWEALNAATLLKAAALPNSPAVPRQKATVTERNGNVIEHYHNEFLDCITERRLTRGLRVGEPAFYETQSTYDADGQLVRRVHPLGNEIRHVYGAGSRAAQRNIVEARRVADATRGGGEDLVTTFTFEPLYNQLASVTDPRGTAATFVPPIGSASAARYTTRTVFDYQESAGPVPEAVEFEIDLSTIPRGLGDVNGDGRVDLSDGNIIRQLRPSVLLRADSEEAARRGSTTQPVVTDIHWNDSGQPLLEIDPEGCLKTFSYHPENDPGGTGQPTAPGLVVFSTRGAGYLKSIVLDAGTTPRRTPTASPVAAETAFSCDAVGNLLSIRNPRGVVTALEVNALNETVQITRGANVNQAAQSGQLITGEPPFGYRTRYIYDANGRRIRTEIENRDGNTPDVGQWIERSFEYDILGNRIQSSDEVDATTMLTQEWRYDASEWLIRTILPRGNVEATVRDERNLVFSYTRGFGTPEASTVRYDYDPNSNLIRRIDAEDNDGNGQPEATTRIYDGFDRPVEVVDALGNRAITSYDVTGNPVRQRVLGHPAGQPAAPAVLLSDQHLRLDELNRVYQQDQALFLASGFNTQRPVSLEDHNSDGFVTTRQEYDARSLRTFLIEDDLEVTETVYDGAGWPVETVDALGNQRFTTYDRNGNVIRAQSFEIQPDGLQPAEVFTHHFVFDQLDRRVRQTGNAGHTIRFHFDSRGNLVRTSDGQGPLINDPLGLFPGPGQSGQINAEGNTKHYFYDGLARLVRDITDLRVNGQGGNPLDTTNPANPDGQITMAYAWTPNNRLASATDDNNRTTTHTYDALDRPNEQILANNTRFRFVFDRDGNLRRTTDPNASVVDCTPDVLNRVTRVDITRGPGVAGTTEQRFGYDGLGHLVFGSDNNGNPADVQTSEWVFDSLGRKIEERQNGSAVSSIVTGDGKRRRLTYANGRVIDLTYDAVDRTKTIRDLGAVNPLASFDYIGPEERLIRSYFGNGTYQVNSYNAVPQVIRIQHALPSGFPFVDHAYGYDHSHHRIGEKRWDDGGAEDQSFLDSAYRLIHQANDQNGIGPLRHFDRTSDYHLDGAGNRVAVNQVIFSGPLLLPYLPNEVNEYTQVAFPRFNSGTGQYEPQNVALQYDENGNLTHDGFRQYSYDAFNRLVSGQDSGQPQPFFRNFHHADGRRCRQRLFNAATGQIIENTAYVWDGTRLIEETPSSTPANARNHVWNWGSARGRWDPRTERFVPTVIQTHYPNLPTSNPNRTLYGHQNDRGDQSALSNNDGQVAARTIFGAFGEHYPVFFPGAVPPGTVPFMFRGCYRDGATGFYSKGTDWYHFELGRWLQRAGSWSPQGFGNGYSFMGNNPVSGPDHARPFRAPNVLELFCGNGADIAPVNSATLAVLGSPSTARPTPGTASAQVSISARQNKMLQAQKVASDLRAYLRSSNRGLGLVASAFDGGAIGRFRDRLTAEGVGGLPGVAGGLEPGAHHEKDLVTLRKAQADLEFTARKMTEIAIEEAWGNCMECGAAAAIELHDRGFANVEIMKRTGNPNTGSGEHVFVVVDRALGSQAGDPTTWGADAFIVDAWDGGRIIEPSIALTDDGLAGVGPIQSFGRLPGTTPGPATRAGCPDCDCSYYSEGPPKR